MHETRLLEKIFQYLEKEEKKLGSKRIKKVYISLSEFGGIKEEHFGMHFNEAAMGTKWKSLKLEIKKIPFGPEIEITKLDF